MSRSLQTEGKGGGGALLFATQLSSLCLARKKKREEKRSRGHQHRSQKKKKRKGEGKSPWARGFTLFSSASRRGGAGTEEKSARRRGGGEKKKGGANRYLSFLSFFLECADGGAGGREEFAIPLFCLFCAAGRGTRQRERGSTHQEGEKREGEAWRIYHSHSSPPPPWSMRESGAAPRKKKRKGIETQLGVCLSELVEVCPPGKGKKKRGRCR